MSETNLCHFKGVCVSVRVGFQHSASVLQLCLTNCIPCLCMTSSWELRSLWAYWSFERPPMDTLISTIWFRVLLYLLSSISTAKMFNSCLWLFSTKIFKESNEMKTTWKVGSSRKLPNRWNNISSECKAFENIEYPCWFLS